MAIISNAVTIADAGAFSVSLGSMVHIKTLTASASATLSFVHGTADVVLDSTYPIYKFEFINIHPSAYAMLSFNASTDSGSNYNVAKTTTTTSAYHAEDDVAADYYYIDSDLAQGTGVANISGSIHTDNDSSLSGEMLLFAPSSTTFVKHFLSDNQRMDFSVRPYTNRWLSAGYMNTTSAINAIQFSMTSGNIDSGKIKLYGIKDS
jgi:hypothetical protein